MNHKKMMKVLAAIGAAMMMVTATMAVTAYAGSAMICVIPASEDEAPEDSWNIPEISFDEVVFPGSMDEAPENPGMFPEMISDISQFEQVLLPDSMDDMPEGPR